MAKRFGIRGRVTAMWVLQVGCGIFCIILGLITINMKNPDSPEFQSLDKVQGVYVDSSGLDDVDWYINGTDGLVKPCGNDYIKAPRYGWANNVTYMRFPTKDRIVISDPNPDCVHNQDSLGVTMIVIICFSICVQMAEGLHFGVVPFISRPALGVVSGMVGAGGNLGALVSGQWIVRAKQPLDQGFIYLGITIMATSLLMHAIFFPGEGGILTGPNFPYDPQWVKPPADAKGSDELDFKDVHISNTKCDSKGKVVLPTCSTGEIIAAESEA